MSYPLCVFLESREQMLPIHHPFYRIVEETLENVIQSSLVLRCMAKHTLVNESHTESPNNAAENQMVQQITRYLRNNFPTVSGSNSPAMDSVIVDVRSYSGCGKDPKSRKFTRKHVYIQKHLVDALMKAEARSKSDDKGACPSLEGHFYLLKFLVKLCLLRGLITVVKFAFMSENIDAKDPTRGSLCLTRNLKFQTLFERFLFEWDGWFIFTENHRIGSKRSRYGRHRLWAIVLADRVFQFCYVSISSDMHPSGISLCPVYQTVYITDILPQSHGKC
ncbi:hypothetical protein K503DRAFT_770535 [Rhizopogon vinicolor AM-OR11-026]|uniref:Uncharacterized protein n=1 Tax=Rhizopogon vinicolor AM-OR11-026 TaxID=1314800 RepID=A0A1B7N0P0_9AGAM|nr:hypothetical protein K503DRAFT_770535 [Rhizopogon vinicolor AM-OR11-026]